MKFQILSGYNYSGLTNGFGIVFMFYFICGLIELLQADWGRWNEGRGKEAHDFACSKILSMQYIFLILFYELSYELRCRVTFFSFSQFFSIF